MYAAIHFMNHEAGNRFAKILTRHMCDMTYSYVWHDSIICVTWLTHVCDMTHSCVQIYISWTTKEQPVLLKCWHVIVQHDSLICVTWLIHIWDLTHSCVWHDSLMCVASFFINHQTAIRFSRQLTSHMCDMNHVRVWHDSPTCVTWLTHMCDMTHPYVWHMTHSYVWHDSLMHVTWHLHAGVAFIAGMVLHIE